MDEAQKRIVVSAIRQMQSSGVGLDPEQREKFNKLQLESAEITSKFSNNVLDSTKVFKLRLTNKADVEGLPQSAKAFAAQQANGMFLLNQLRVAIQYWHIFSFNYFIYDENAWFIIILLLS